jgi:hypothetical protein
MKWDKVPHSQPQKFLPTVTKEITGGLIDLNIASIIIEDENSVQGIIKQTAIAFLALS